MLTSPAPHLPADGLGESQYGPIFGASYIPRCNMEFLKLCTRGVGVLVASGDAGASNNGHGSESCAIQPDFPSSSPWITSVSASFVSNKAPARFGQTLGELPISIPNGMFWTTGGGKSVPPCPLPSVCVFLALCGVLFTLCVAVPLHQASPRSQPVSSPGTRRRLWPSTLPPPTPTSLPPPCSTPPSVPVRRACVHRASVAVGVTQNT